MDAADARRTTRGEHRRFGLATVLLGIGLGGFFDGIVLHQVLQWHHMISAATPPDTLSRLELNTTFDGLFHALTWIVTLAGTVLLLAAERPRSGVPSAFVGGLLVGWGLFNVVEGVVDHHILALHHGRPGPDEVLYDLGFLLWGAAMLGVGSALWRSANRGSRVARTSR